MLDMFFESAKDALAFYIRYTWLPGFDIRRNRTRNNGRAQEDECSASREYKGSLQSMNISFFEFTSASFTLV
jgi:hypothetical protein